MITWCIKLTGRLTNIAPACTIFSIVFTAISEFFTLASSLLPLQIIIILGTGGQSRFLPEQFSHIEVNKIVLGLCGVTAIFLIFRQLITVWVTKLIDVGTKKVIDTNDKFIIFEDQNEIAKETYNKIVELVSSFLFSISGILFIGLLYLEAAIAYITIIIFVTLGVYTLVGYTNMVTPRIKNDFRLLLPTASNIALFMFLGFFIYEFIFGTPPQFIFAILSVILARLLFGQLGKLASSIYMLTRIKEKADVLFFSNLSYSPPNLEIDNDIWALLSPDNYPKWIKEIAHNFLTLKPHEPELTVRWRQSNIIDLLLLQIDQTDSDVVHVVKIYNPKRHSLAQHECSLFLEAPDTFPAPKMVYSTTMGDYLLNVFAINKDGLDPDIRPPHADIELRKQLLGLSFHKDFEERYLRSHKLLPDRLHLSMIERLSLVAPAKYGGTLARVRNNFDAMKNRIKHLPLSVVSPGINMSFVVAEMQGTVKYYHWAEWRLEISGFGWPLIPNWETNFNQALKDASAERPELTKCSLEDFYLSAILSAFETDMRFQKYSDAMKKLELAVTYS